MIKVSCLRPIYASCNAIYWAAELVLWILSREGSIPDEVKHILAPVRLQVLM